MTATPEFKEQHDNVPVCTGCDKCGKTQMDDEEILFAFAMNAWMCRQCFFGTSMGRGWKKEEQTKDMSNLQDENATLRKQVLAYQKDLATARKVLYYIIKKPENAKAVAERCLKELKQT